MTATTNPTRYSATAIALHWLLGVTLVALFVLGLYMTSLPFSPQRLKLYNWHKWAGAVVLTLSFVRLAWRLTHRPPALPAAVAAAMPTWQHWAHHGTHHALYLLFFAVPLLGWAYSSAAGFPIVVFGVLPLPDFVAPDKALAELIKPWHGYAAYAMAALVALHVAAALKHQFIDGDGLLARMLPGRR
jgi:cytochrome b561